MEGVDQKQPCPSRTSMPKAEPQNQHSYDKQTGVLPRQKLDNMKIGIRKGFCGKDGVLCKGQEESWSTPLGFNHCLFNCPPPAESKSFSTIL